VDQLDLRDEQDALAHNVAPVQEELLHRVDLSPVPFPHHIVLLIEHLHYLHGDLRHKEAGHDFDYLEGCRVGLGVDEEEHRDRNVECTPATQLLRHDLFAFLNEVTVFVEARAVETDLDLGEVQTTVDQVDVAFRRKYKLIGHVEHELEQEEVEHHVLDAGEKASVRYNQRVFELLYVG